MSSDAAYRSDPRLIQACLAGDEVAWSELVEKYERLVLSVARKCGLSDTDADDVFQIVFTILYRRLEARTDQTRLSSWLITTTYRESWRFRKGGETQTLPDEAVEDTGTPPEDLVAQAEKLMNSARRDDPNWPIFETQRQRMQWRKTRRAP